MKGGEKKGLFDIDPADLPEEWLVQPSLYHRWARKAAAAREHRDRAKADLELVEAETAVRVRRYPKKYGMKTTTEASIKEVVRTTREVKVATSNYLAAKADVDYAEVGVSSLEHKKRALEKLVDLALADFFSVPKKPKGEAAREKLTEAVKRKARAVRRRGREV